MGTVFNADIILRNGNMSDFDENKLKKGEPAIATDVGRLFVGVGNSTAIEFARQDAVDGKIATTDIADNLTTDDANKVLSAKQGKVLNERLNTAESDIGELDSRLTEIGATAATNLLTTARHERDITQIENTLSALNYNNEPRVSVSSYAKSVTFPKNTAQGGLKATVKGNTLNNGIVNGNFANGTTGFTADSSGTLSVSDGELKVKGNGTSRYLYQRAIVSDVPMTDGHKYYISLRIKALTGNAPPQFVVNYIGTTGGTQSAVAVQNAVAANTSYRMSNIVTSSGKTGNMTIISLGVYDTAGDSLNKEYLTKDWICINLTLAGLDTLTKKQLDAMTENWFGGVKNVISPRLRSVDKNGLNPTYQYTAPRAMRRTAAGDYDEISGGSFIKRVGDDGVALAAPIITENVTSGTLLSYPGGTVYAEPAIADAGVYGTSMSILYTDYPIKTLESAKKIDFATGEETSLDISAAVIAGDGKSFTHSGLASGDIVFFTYLYDVQRVGGENTYSYLDSNHVLEDTANGKFYTYKPVITNGAIASWTVTEVQ